MRGMDSGLSSSRTNRKHPQSPAGGQHGRAIDGDTYSLKTIRLAIHRPMRMFLNHGRLAMQPSQNGSRLLGQT
jgi:hypothetical protein